MKIKRYISLVLFGLALEGCNMTLPTQPYPLASEQADRYATLRTELSEWIIRGMKRHKITGMSIALMDDNEIVWAQGFGYQDKTNNKLATADTLYKAGSISKVFTATAIMQLVEQGKVDLDAPIQTYIPELKPKYHFKADTPITLRHIMSHRSGLSGSKMAGMFTAHPLPYQTVIEYLNTVHHPYAPGTVTAYSNLATDLQGIVIERVSGEHFEDYVQRHILAPLGMHNSHFSDANVDASRLSRAYRHNKEGEEPPLRDIPAGNLHSSVIDLSRFAGMVMNQGGSLLQAKSLQEMLRMQELQGAPQSRISDFGLNWVIDRPALSYLGKVAWHNGGTIHFMSTMVILPERGLSVVVLCNSANGLEFVEQVADLSLQQAALIQFDIDKPAVPAKSPVTPLPLPLYQQLPGHYATAAGAVKFTPSGNTVKAQLMGLTLKLKHHEDGWLSLHPRLFGFIPLPIKQLTSLQIKLEHTEQQTLLITKVQGSELLAGTKVEPYTIPDRWSQAIGRYMPLLPEGDFPWIRDITLIVKDGYLYAASRVENQGALMSIIRPVSDDMGVIEGIGQGMQETIYLTHEHDTPVLHYSGYRFVKAA